MRLTACLQLNADFEGFSPPSNDTLTLVRVSSTQEPDDWTTSKQDLVPTSPIDDPLPSHPSPTSTPSTQVILASSTGESASSSLTLSSSVANSSSGSLPSSSSADSSGSTSTSLQQEVWIPLEIRNPSPDQALLDSTTISLSFDHASLVTAGANPDGSNLHIVARDNGVWKQLHRVLDPESQWNRTNTQIWFSLDRVIPANQNQTEHFYLVVDSKAPKLEDPTEVFLLFDDFSGPALDTSKWNLVQTSSGAGSSSATVDNGQLLIRATATGGAQRSHRVMTRSTWKLPAIAVDAVLRARDHSNGNDCTQEFLSSYWSDHQPPLINAAWLQKQQGIQFANHANLGQLMLQSANGTLGGATPSRYSNRWVGTNIELWRGGVRLDSKTTLSSFATTPEVESLHIGFEAIGVGGSCTNVQSEVVVDWVMVRKLSLAQPQLQLDYARQSASRPI